MDSELISQLRNIEDRDKAINILNEGRKVLLAELDPVIGKLMVVNKEMAIDILEEHVNYLNDSLALITSYLIRDSREPVTAEQGLLLASLKHCIRNVEINNNLSKE